MIDKFTIQKQVYRSDLSLERRAKIEKKVKYFPETVTGGVSLKSPLRVERSYPFPTATGGIKGLFLSAASVQSQTPHSLNSNTIRDGVLRRPVSN